jgi:uncharacterized membrane protein
MSTPNDPQTVPQPALTQALQQWLGSLRVALGRLFNIAVLETRLAALSFVLILVIGVASGLLLASAWIALLAAVVSWFHALGMSWQMALLLMAAINFVLAAVGGYAIYRLSNNMLFKTIRTFIMAMEVDDDSDTAAVTSDENEQPARTN